MLCISSTTRVTFVQQLNWHGMFLDDLQAPVSTQLYVSNW